MGHGYELISEAWPRARRDHRCIWCGEWIARGTTYKHEVSKYEDALQNHHWHRECWESFHENMLDYETEFEPYMNERPKPEFVS